MTVSASCFVYLKRICRLATFAIVLVYVLHVLKINIIVIRWQAAPVSPWTKTSVKEHAILLQQQLKESTSIRNSELQNQSRNSQHAARKSNTVSVAEENEFMKFWSLHQKFKFSYTEHLSACENSTDWKQHYPDRNVDTITSARGSFLSTFDIRPIGQFSRFVIQSVSYSGKRKLKGGDSYRVHIKGASSVPVNVRDLNDGSYEVFFLILEPGYYEAEVYLDYTLCDGYKDPPKHWFIMGNAQGKYQPPEALPGSEKPYLEEKFQKVIFQVSKGQNSVAEHLRPSLETNKSRDCMLWDGYGRWVHHGNGRYQNTWLPFVISDTLSKVTDIPRRNGRGVFWIYGDSVGEFLYRSLQKRPSFLGLFSSINRTYNWVYNLKDDNLTWAKVERDSKDFSIDRVLTELNQVLNHPAMDSDSVLLLNYGLHFVQDVRFELFKELMDSVAFLLRAHQSSDKGFRGKIIWKTTSALFKEKYGPPETNARHSKGVRFLTAPRVQMYNAYSSAKMCDSKIDILDVYDMTDSYPHGSGSPKKPWDAVHFEPRVFEAMMTFLEHYLNYEDGTVHEKL